MTYRFLSFAIYLLSALVVSAATSPIVVIRSPVHSPPDIAPQIDAKAFVNESVFEVNDYGSYGFDPLPYQMANTVCFTNRGFMYGDPGFRFDYYTGFSRGPMTWWCNEGDIASANTNMIYSASGRGQANWLTISSSNIVNKGYLSGDAHGLIKIAGNSVNLSQGRIRTGNSISEGLTYLSYYLLSTNYFNDSGIFDYWWAVGDNNVLSGNGK